MKKWPFSTAVFLALCLYLLIVEGMATGSDFVIKDVNVPGRGIFPNVLTAYNGPGGTVVIPEGVQYVGLGIGLGSGGEGGSVFAGRQDITNVSIPRSAVAIGGNAFAGCTGLASLTIPDNVSQLGTEAFAGCTGLTSVTIPGSVQKIPTAAFSGCTGLKSLTLCEGIKIISGDSFRDCINLKSVVIPESVTTLESISFLGCTNLADIRIPQNVDIEGKPFGDTAWWENQGDWIVINGTLLAYRGTKTSVVIPDNVTSIGGSWYNGGYWKDDEWHGLVNAVIPHSVTKIKDNAFWHCDELESIDIPDSVTYIGGRAFADTGLTKVVIPDSVTVIGNAAFEECYQLKSIEIPGSVTDIDPSKRGIPAFDRAPNVTIHGTAGSFAEAYAKEHRIPFIADLSPWVAGFNDVREADYYAAPVSWAVESGITAGTSKTTFSPSTACSTAQIITFLWRAQGQPEPNIENPFSDVSAQDYYYKAVLWAHEKGLIEGTAFHGSAPCTRGSTVTYLWKLAESPVVPPSQFTDVSDTADYAQAVAWAVEKGITGGTSATTFNPNQTCTRGQIVTFLYRAYH